MEAKRGRAVKPERHVNMLYRDSDTEGGGAEGRRGEARPRWAEATRERVRGAGGSRAGLGGERYIQRVTLHAHTTKTR